jgi:hypothetical protein
LNNRTEKTTPKERPREERMRRVERQRSHYVFVLALFGAGALKGVEAIGGKRGRIEEKDDEFR